MKRRDFLKGLLALPAVAVVRLPEVATAAKAVPVEPFLDRSVMLQSYTVGFRVTEEMILDDQWDLIDRMSQDRVRSIRDHQDRRFS